MKLLILTLILFPITLLSQSPREVAQDQLEAYNNKDIEAFMKVFSSDIELWTLGDSIPSVQGFESVKKVYKNLFEKSPNLHSEVINRTIIGNKVIDYEIITGRSGSKSGTPFYLVMIYEIRDGKIFRATAVRQ